MTKQEAIKKYNLQLKKQDDFAKRYNITTYTNEIEDDETRVIYTLTNEFSKVMQDEKETYFLIMQKIYKNEYVCDKNGLNCRHKGYCRTYEMKE